MFQPCPTTSKTIERNNLSHSTVISNNEGREKGKEKEDVSITRQPNRVTGAVVVRRLARFQIKDRNAPKETVRNDE